MKRIFSFSLVIILLTISIFVSSCSCRDSDEHKFYRATIKGKEYEYDGFIYYKYDDYIHISDLTEEKQKEKHLIIPSEIKGIPVTAIGNKGYLSGGIIYGSYRTVYIPSSVKSFFGSEVFKNSIGVEYLEFESISGISKEKLCSIKYDITYVISDYSESPHFISKRSIITETVEIEGVEYIQKGLCMEGSTLIKYVDHNPLVRIPEYIYSIDRDAFNVYLLSVAEIWLPKKMEGEYTANSFQFYDDKTPEIIYY